MQRFQARSPLLVVAVVGVVLILIGGLVVFTAVPQTATPSVTGIDRDAQQILARFREIDRNLVAIEQALTSPSGTLSAEQAEQARQRLRDPLNAFADQADATVEAQPGQVGESAFGFNLKAQDLGLAQRNLLALLQQVADSADLPAYQQNYQQSDLVLVADGVRTTAQQTYINGLLALHDLGADPQVIDPQLADLAVLWPTTMPERAALSSLRGNESDYAIVLSNRWALRERPAFREAEYQARLAALLPSDADSATALLQKAQQLVELGAFAQADQVYAEYSARFQASDPNAERIGTAAQQLLRLRQPWGISAGMLVTAVIPASAAEQAQIRVGDIIIRFKGQPISAPEDLNHSYGAAPILEYIHFATDGSQPELRRLEVDAEFAGVAGVGL